MILMVLVKTSQDIVISAGGIAGLNHETFLSVSFAVIFSNVSTIIVIFLGYSMVLQCNDFSSEFEKKLI